MAMSICSAKIGTAAILGTMGLAQVVPSADPISAYERFGTVGLLICIVVALWLDSKKDQKAAAEYRAERQRKEDEHRAEDMAQAKEFLNALNALNQAIRENALKCDARRDQMEDLVDKAIRK